MEQLAHRGHKVQLDQQALKEFQDRPDLLVLLEALVQRDLLVLQVQVRPDQQAQRVHKESSVRKAQLEQDCQVPLALPVRKVLQVQQVQQELGCKALQVPLVRRDQRVLKG